MKIKNVDGLTADELSREISNGGKFVFYYYTVSVIFMTFRRPTDIYFVKAGEKAAVKGLPFTIVSLLLGWWGIPWGPIYTIQSLVKNLGGGKDVTETVMASLAVKSPLDETELALAN
ncbi:hypothetical protein [Foetidibacter luteolus]|uniref:hypothetical protein n=1 Tax=Foetidibacter luteolus TaxID=2608880 RepID=UPI00129B806B|nr:hypothetical protein [Foetidibacter luteolus]